jgi:hypothetical protein
MPFDANAPMLDRVAALESAVDGGLGDGGANAELDKQLANLGEANRLLTGAIKDLDQRHRDLYAKVDALQARLDGAPAPKTTAAKPAA